MPRRTDDQAARTDALAEPGPAAPARAALSGSGRCRPGYGREGSGRRVATATAVPGGGRHAKALPAPVGRRTRPPPGRSSPARSHRALTYDNTRNSPAGGHPGRANSPPPRAKLTGPPVKLPSAGHSGRAGRNTGATRFPRPRSPGVFAGQQCNAVVLHLVLRLARRSGAAPPGAGVLRPGRFGSRGFSLGGDPLGPLPVGLLLLAGRASLHFTRLGDRGRRGPVRGRACNPVDPSSIAVIH